MKIKVFGLGPLKKAEIDLKPITIFLGKNKRGKSYLMRLIYVFLASIYNPSPENFRIEEKNSKKIILRLFQVNLSKDQIESSERIKFEDIEIPPFKRNEGWTFKLKIDKEIEKEKFDEEFEKIMEKRLGWRWVLYLPSSRAGLLVSFYPFLSAWYVYQKAIASSHPISLRHFLLGINELFSGRGEYELGKFGRIKVEEGEVYYIENQKKVNFLNAASSIQELLPILWFLYREVRKTLIFIDEPESHLHPEWQVELAREMVKNAREKENWFVVSTHSDIFFLALVNSVLESIKNEKKVIKKEDVENFLAIYLFGDDGQVEKIEIGKEGISKEQWSKINSELAEKYNDLIQRIEK